MGKKATTVLLLVSGASGAGKSTARRGAAVLLDETFEAVELSDFGPVPEAPTVAWRQRTVEQAVRRALELENTGRHLLLAGDPVPAGELLAAPSAHRIDAAVCLLDVDEHTQTERLAARGDPAELLPLHVAFAEWLRAHAGDPGHNVGAITSNGWEQMQWQRWLGKRPGDWWSMRVIDTSARTGDEVAELVADWCRAAVRGEAPVFRAGVLG